MKIYLFLFLLTINFAFSKDIFIIGAGVSGIKAAFELKKNHSVKILEARKRIGGRVHSDFTFGYALDLGAAWIHKHIGNPIYDLSEQFQVPTVQFSYNSVKIYNPLSSPNVITDDDFEKVVNGFKEYKRRLKTNNQPDESIETCLNRYILENNLDDYSKKLLRNWAFAEIEIEFASKPNYLSRDNYNSSEQFEGKDFLIPSGYINIFNPLANGLNIQYETIIEKIEQVNNKVNIYDKNGRVYTSDIVVVTVPLGCLKKNTISFIPDLSQEKRNAINKMNFGTMNKVIVEFSERFWDDTNLIRIITDPLVRFPWMVNYSKIKNANVLIFLTTDEFLEKKTDDAIKSEVIESLSKIYDANRIRITRFIRTDWRNDPFSFGSYSSYGVGTSFKEIENLAKPEGLIYFAGEHTHKQYPSTIHGAYLSGEDVAKKINQAFRKLKLKK